jgi:hypothetical protein
MPIYQSIERHVTKHSILGIIYTFPQSSPENIGQIPNTGHPPTPKPRGIIFEGDGKQTMHTGKRLLWETIKHYRYAKFNDFYLLSITSYTTSLNC